MTIFSLSAWIGLLFGLTLTFQGMILSAGCLSGPPAVSLGVSFVLARLLLGSPGKFF
jgi:hypothetical protein